jgi:transcription antitermination factor NusA-like protein
MSNGGQVDNVRSSLNQLTDWCKGHRSFLKNQLDKLEAGQLTVFEVDVDNAKTDVTAEEVARIIAHLGELNRLLAEEDELDTEAAAKGNLPSAI